jgi:hypothetical protein
MPKKHVLATILFNLKPETTRSLTATQPGDSSQTRIIFGSTNGKLKRKDLKKDLLTPVAAGTVAMQWNEYGGVRLGDKNGNKQSAIFGPTSVSLYFSPGSVGSHDKKKGTSNPADVIGFSGFYVPEVLGPGEKDDPKPADKGVFVGNINVTGGQYQDWFGAKAALTYDAASGEGTLRIYGK